MNVWLQFTDAAKFADIARNLTQGNGFVTGFNFFSKSYLDFQGPYSASFTPPAMPYFIALFFKIFGVSDASVIATSFVFFFLTAIFTFFLGKKLFGKTVGVLASFVVLINQNFVDYAKTGASETLFMFEIVAIPYLVLLKKRWATFTGFTLLLLMYFTRPQAFIFIAGFILFYLLLNYKFKKALLVFTGVLFIGLLIDRMVLLPLNGRHFLYSITGRGTHAITQHSQYIAVSDVLRGVGEQPSSIILTVKKTGTNLFNFYRSLPNIANPYLFTFFILSPLVLFKKKEERVFAVITFFTAVLSFLLPALTIPFYRYIHPVLPLVYIVGIASLDSVIRKIIPKNLKGRYAPALFSFILVSVFVLAMQIGILIHDYKYYEVRHNLGKPPVYVLMSWKLKEETQPGDFIITNLDAWGSWYGERKTMWFPLEPDHLDTGGVNHIDAIYLTSYLIDDENYYMGDAWRQIFKDPKNIDNKFIRENFEFAGEYIFPASEVYEKYDARAVLLLRKD